MSNITFAEIPLCVLQYIADKYLNFNDIINIIKINKKCNRIKIKDFYNIPDKIKNKLTNEILNKYNDIEKLDANNNPKITNINHLEKLKTLCAYGDCGINNEGIKNLTNLKYFDASHNQKITNINH